MILPEIPEAVRHAIVAAMGENRTGRQSVYIGKVDDDFHPGMPSNLPERLSIERFDTGLSVPQAIAFVRLFNTHQLRTGLIDRYWAMIGFRPMKGDLRWPQ